MANETLKPPLRFRLIKNQEASEEPESSENDPFEAKSVSMTYYAPSGKILLSVQNVEKFSVVEDEESDFYGFDCIEEEATEEGYSVYFLGAEDNGRVVVAQLKFGKKE
jgi:flagellar basal body rod protein FlgC